MEKGDAEQEGHARNEDDDNVNDDRGNSASIIEENLITNICCDSVSSPNNTNELSFSSVNTDQLSSADSEKESRSEIYKNNFATCNASESKFNSEHINLSNVDPDDVTMCGSGNDSLPRQNAHYQSNIHNSSVDEDNPVSCGSRIILESDETKKNELDNKNVHESINLNALATVLNENGKKCPITAEHIIDKTDVDILGAISVSQMNENGVNSYSHEGKSSTNLVNNNNILPVFTQAAESSCQQQTSSGFTTSDKTKVSFSFPLNNDSNFNFGMNDAFSNMPASKNSFQIKSHNKIAPSSIANITPACNTSVGLFERQADIFRSLPKSTIQTCQISDSLTTVKSNMSSVECSVPPFKMPLFGISVTGTSISSSSVQTPHTSENRDTPKNSETGCFIPSYVDFKISSKTRNTMEHISVSPSFGSSAYSKNLFPMTVGTTAPVQGTSVKTFAPLENNVLAFSVGTLNSIFPVTSQQSPSFFKSITSASPLKLPKIKASKLDVTDRTFQSSLSGSTSLHNNQTTMSSSTLVCGECNKTPFFDKTNVMPLFGSSVAFPKAESSQQSIDTSSHSNCFTSTALSKLETSNKTSSLAFGCISKQNSTEQFLLEYNTPLKSNQADITGPLPKSNPYSSSTTPSTNGFNFGTSNTGINFSFGNSSATPNNNLPFIFMCSENGMSKSKLHARRLNVFAPCKSHFNISEIPKIPFRVVKDIDFSVENGRIELRYQCITTMPEYSSFSFEELRCYYDKYNIKPLLPTAVPETFTTKNRMINKGTQTLETLQDHLVDIWKALECPVCLEIVTPPIHQCEQGHHVCNGCWRKIASCPLCKRYKMQTRNYVAEVMVEKLPLPCKYRFDGCMKTMQQKEKIAHEEMCTFRTYCCLVHDCNKLHCYKDMVVHMKTAHGHLMTSNEGSWHPGSWTLTKPNFQKLIHAFEIPYWGLFFLRHKSLGQNNYIWMQMLNIGASEKGFFYSVEVADIKELRSVSYKGPVFPLHATLNDNQDCLIVPDSLLNTLKRDSLLRVKISIWEKQP